MTWAGQFWFPHKLLHFTAYLFKRRPLCPLKCITLTGHASCSLKSKPFGQIGIAYPASATVHLRVTEIIDQSHFAVRRRHRKLSWLKPLKWKLWMVLLWLLLCFAFIKGNVSTGLLYPKRPLLVVWKWGGRCWGLLNVSKQTFRAKAGEQILVLGLFPLSTWYAQQSLFFVPEWLSSRMAWESGATKITSKTWVWGTDGAFIRCPEQVLLWICGSQETLRASGFSVWVL